MIFFFHHLLLLDLKLTKSYNNTGSEFASGENVGSTYLWNSGIYVFFLISYTAISNAKTDGFLYNFVWTVENTSSQQLIQFNSIYLFLQTCTIEYNIICICAFTTVKLSYKFH